MGTQAAGAEPLYLTRKNFVLERVKTLPPIECYLPLNFPASINTVLFKVELGGAGGNRER
jgi:hypothetical protein